MKRLFDVIASIIGIVIMSPILLIVALIILFTDGKPILFTQDRMGMNGKAFKCYKFRSMHRDTPQEVATSQLEDPYRYISKVGKVIRSTSIDELPQLFNVLKGDMSIVGPRPLVLSERYMHKLRTKAGIYQLRPGLTGLAQINGRDEVFDSVKLKYDIEYLKHTSIKLDIYIILMTVWVVLMKIGISEGKAPQQPHTSNLHEQPHEKVI